MSLFKKPNRKFRQRVTQSDSENDEEEHGRSEKEDLSNVGRQDIAMRDPVSTCKPLHSNPSTVSSTKEKIVAKLSFHDEDEEGEVFQVKKSNYSRRLAKQRERERKKRLEKLTNKTGPAQPENNFQAVSNNRISGDIPNNNAPKTSVLPKPIKNDDVQTETNTYDPIQSQEVVQMELDSEDDESELDKSREENMRIMDRFRGALQSGVIPDAATIYAMKKRRQLAREMGEFGPNEDSEHSYENKSRLIRDDDNDRSDEDDGEEGRINFTVNTDVLERQKVKKAFISAEEEAAHGSGDEEAEEVERWVQEQIRKGVSIPQVQPTLPQPYQVEPPKLMGYEYSQPSTFNISTTPGFTTFSSIQKQAKKPSSVNQKKEKAAISTESIKQRLTEKLSEVSEARGLHKQECTICQQSIQACEDAIEKLERDAPNLALQFRLYQELRVYVADLIECLNAKVPIIDSLEQRMHLLWKKRADQLVQRRQQDIKDQADEFSFLCKRMTAGLGIDLSEDKFTTHDEVKLRRIAEREGRKMRRRKAREIKQPDVKHYEGLSSDNEESDVDLLKFTEEQEEILSEAQFIFDDVVEDYSNLVSAKQRFEKWKAEQPETYNDAYIPNCLPKILAPFIRLELLTWNPLYDSKDIENLGWYETLVFYGCSKESLKNYVSDSDVDLNLVPTLVDRVVIPKLTKIVENVWDPMSTVQTIRLVNLIKKYMDDYPEVNGKSKRVQAFLQAVTTRMCQTLDDDIFVPLYPKELLENRTVNANAFFQRQFWSCVKLLRNMLSWHGILADKPLRELALNCLLNRYILLGLQKTQGDIAEKAKVINSVLPRTWFSPGENNVIPELEMYKRFTEPFAQVR